MRFDSGRGRADSRTRQLAGDEVAVVMLDAKQQPDDRFGVGGGV